MTDLETILSWFQTGDMPTQEEFQETFSSFRHKNTKIPIAEVDGLESLLNSKINADDYIKEGKIRADKIEALGLTELIESTEQDISEFAENSDKYEFQQNDFIAVPNEDGTFSLYLFKGGEKRDKSNYLPTGLTNITISMVEDLQYILNGKIGKPLTDGSFFTRQNAGVTSQQLINPSANYLSAWNGSDFVASPIFTDGTKLGIGNSTPTEQLHLIGRAKMSALVLDENSENLPGQITRSENRFFGTNSSGIKRSIMYNDFADYKNIWQNMTEAEKTEIKTAMNGGWTTNTMSVFLVTPSVIDVTINNNMYVTLRGANLNFNPANFSVQIVSLDGSTVIQTIPNSQVQLYSDGLTLVFYYNFSSIPEESYKIRLNNGAALYTTSVLNLVSKVQNIDLASNTWSTKTYNDLDNALSSNSFSSFLYKQDSDVKPAQANDTTFVYGILSDALFLPADNFHIEFNFTMSAHINMNDSFFVGLTDETTVSFMNTIKAGIRAGNNGSGLIIIDYNGSTSEWYQAGDIITVSITKIGNSVNTFIRWISPIVGNRTLNSIAIVDFASPIRLKGLFKNSSNDGVQESLNILKAYKF